MDDLSLVHSIYERGAVCCWFFLVASVLVSWLSTHRRDTITNDHFAVLVLPAVAACDLIYQVCSFPGPRSHILTTSDPTLLPSVAAIEAPLSLCDTASLLLAVLASFAAWNQHARRFLLTGLVALLCGSAQTCLFFVSSSSIKTTNLSRPYVVNSPEFMYSVMTAAFGIGIPAVLYSFCVVMQEGLFISTLDDDDDDVTNAQTAIQRGLTILQKQSETSTGRRRLFRWITLFAVPVLLGGLAQTLLSPSVALGLTASGPAWASFLPRTRSNNLGAFDQMVTASIGAIALLYSLVDAFKLSDSWLKFKARRLSRAERPISMCEVCKGRVGGEEQ